MALLLAMYQKMRLIREKNQLVLDQTRISSKLTRVQKNIEKVQKRYTSILEQARATAKLAESQFNSWIQGASGLGMDGINIWNFGAGGGMSQFVMAGMAQWANEGTKDRDGNEICSQRQAAAIWGVISSGGSFSKNDSDGTPTADGMWVASTDSSIRVSDQEYQAYRAAMNYVQQQQSMRQQQVNQMKTMFASNASIFTQANEEAIEAEQDAALEPLNYEQTMLELEKEQKDTRLARINEEIETYKQLVSQEVKNSTPTFGLA